VAFDFFGLFGREEKPPEPSPQALPYEVEFEIAGDEKSLRQALRDVSTLYRLRTDPTPDAETLVRRAQADLVPMIDALWGAGHYNAKIEIQVAGVPIRLQTENTAAAVRAAEAYRNRGLVPIRVVSDPGDLFVLRDVALLDGRTNRPLIEQGVPPRVLKLEAGDPARSAEILSAQARIVDYYRAQSRPFAKVTDVSPTVYHPQEVMDLSVKVEPGPVAGIGPITIRGLTDVDPRVVRSFIYTEPGDPYSPAELAAIRKSILKIEAISSVRVREAQALDEYGNLPLTLDVTERLKRAIGASAQYSTTDGPTVRAYWVHRNLFGGAERLRLEANVFYLTENGGRLFDVASSRTEDLGGRFTVSFLKPALWGTRNDLLADARVERDRTDGYTSRLANGTVGIRHRFSETFSIQGGVEVEKGQTSDVLGQIDYTLVGLPASLEWDSTDDPLNPTRGFKLTGGITPYPEAFGSSVGFFLARASASTYFALDEDARYILAGRIGLGSISGADLEDIPANRRFFAGGGGSVRGYRYRSLGPQFLGQPIGGRSLFEASLEARIKVTDTIGIVPFVDAGTAFADSIPDFDQKVRVSAGLGLRYYTGIGPIRVDVATPLNRERRDRPVALYIGIGQSF
jgi:translocation and assembly module TamA